MSQSIIPIFFSSDDKYLPFLAVSVRSLIDNADKSKQYRLCVLYTDIPEAQRARVTAMATPNITIDFIDMAEVIAPVMEHFSLRDYYTVSIYFRLFIPTLFPEYEKAIYMDCDVAVQGDVSRLFETELGDNLVAVVPDAIINDNRILRKYAEEVIGLDSYRQYFNSGMMVMNLRRFRELDILGKFISLLTRYAFPVIAPDQDYLNALCRGHAVYLDAAWNKMYSRRPYHGELYIIHYNMFLKPWLYTEVPYGDIFWEYAKKTDFYEQILQMRHTYRRCDRIRDKLACRRMMRHSIQIRRGDNTFALKLKDDPIMEDLRK